MNSNSPEDRLLDELLHEQTHGPDEAFLKQIELAVDAGPKIQVARRSYARLAIAATLTLAAGGGIWWRSLDQNPYSLAVSQIKTSRSELRAPERLEIVPGGMKIARAQYNTKVPASMARKSSEPLRRSTGTDAVGKF